MQKNQQSTELVFILDRSGSMRRMEEQAVESFNRFLRDQKDVEGEAGLTLVLFNDRIEKPIESDDISAVNEITAADFRPRGMTALLDAIGKSIRDTRRKIKKLSETQRPGKVIFAVFTDGYENASTKYSWSDIASKISKRTSKDGWEFLFLAANEDAIATASQLNIHRDNASQVLYSKSAMSSWGGSVSGKAKAMRLKSMDLNYDEACYSKALSKLVEEDLEEEKNIKQ